MKFVSLLFTGCVLSLGAVVHAQARTDFDLNWTVPSSCPGEASLRAEVAKLAPRATVRDRRLRIDGTVRSSARGFELDLVLRDGEFAGRRRFASESCAEVVGAAAVTIALLLSSGSVDASAGASEGSQVSGAEDAGAAGDGSRSQPAPSTVVVPASTEAAAEPRPPAATPERDARADGTSGAALEAAVDRRWRLVLAAPSFGFGFGLLPDASVGLGGGLGVEFEGWRLLVSAFRDFDSSVHRANGSNQGADLARGALRLSACRWFGSDRWRIAPCATCALTRLVAHGVGAGVDAERADATWVALGPGWVGAVGLSDWLRLAASGGLELQAARPVLVIEGLGEIAQIGALELFAQVGAEWIF